MLETKRKGSAITRSKALFNAGCNSLHLPLFMTFKQAASSFMLFKNLRQPVLLASVLIGGTTMFAGQARAALFISTCSFTSASDCTGASNAGWTTDYNNIPTNPNPRQLGDKLLEIQSHVFGSFDNSGNPIASAPGRFDFEWLDGASDTWTLRTILNPPTIIGGLTLAADATGTLDYTLTITNPNNSFSSVEIDSAHIGTGTTVTKTIAGKSGSLISTDGSSSTVSLGGTVAIVKDVYSVPGAGSAGLNSFSNGFTQQQTTVPGPLPLLGAGAAFGFSRRIRSRIKGARLV